jgi:apolipoprotein D and lipocalin family protein
MKNLIVLMAALFCISSSAFAMGSAHHEAPLSTVEKVNLNNYTGQWFEIARIPQIFEKNCQGAIAEYTLLQDGKIEVLNTCRKFSCEGRAKVAKGIARVVDDVNFSKLKVSFFWPFEGDYWILKLGENYEYAVVGSPDRKSLWLLSRTPKLSQTFIDEIKAEFAAQGFNTAVMEQPTSCEK